MTRPPRFTNKYRPESRWLQPQVVGETISAAQVSSESAGTLGDMDSLLVSAAANALGFGTYLEKIEELSADFSALTPPPTELAEDHKGLSSNFEELRTTAEQPSVGNLSSLPNWWQRRKSHGWSSKRCAVSRVSSILLQGQSVYFSFCT